MLYLAQHLSCLQRKKLNSQLPFSEHLLGGRQWLKAQRIVLTAKGDAFFCYRPETGGRQ